MNWKNFFLLFTAYSSFFNEGLSDDMFTKPQTRRPLHVETSAQLLTQALGEVHFRPPFNERSQSEMSPLYMYACAFLCGLETHAS